MITVEIVLILVGVAFLVGSYFIEEKFSEKDIQEISKMSEAQLNMIVEKQVNSARTEVENSVEEIIEDSLAVTKRGLEKETNEKIMAINEYSDTVLETMNKTHNEIMFLYSMLNDKHTELTEFAGELQKITKSVNSKVPDSEETPQQKTKEVVQAKQSSEEKQAVLTEESKEKVSSLMQDAEGIQETIFMNKNERILQLHKEGRTDVEIAKTLDCGLGEVKLVLGLYKEE